MKSIEEIIIDEADTIYPNPVETGAFSDWNKVPREAYISGRSKSIEAEKKKDERIKKLEEGIRWVLENTQSVFVFSELSKLLNNK